MTHPFLSLFVTLHFLERAVGPDAATLRRLRDAYLEPWTAELPRRELARAADLGAALGSIPGALVWFRVITAIAGVQSKDPNEMAEALDRVGAAIEGLPAG